MQTQFFYTSPFEDRTTSSRETTLNVLEFLMLIFGFCFSNYRILVDVEIEYSFLSPVKRWVARLNSLTNRDFLTLCIINYRLVPLFKSILQLKRFPLTLLWIVNEDPKLQGLT